MELRHDTVERTTENRIRVTGFQMGKRIATDGTRKNEEPAFGEDGTVTVAGEKARQQEKEAYRKEAEEAMQALSTLTEKENLLSAELVAHIQSRPATIYTMPDEQHQVRIQQAEAELGELKRQWEWAFLLVGSKKKALKESIENKQKELEAFRAQQKWVSHREAKARELAVASEKRQRCADRLTKAQTVLKAELSGRETKRATWEKKLLKTEKKWILEEMQLHERDEATAYTRYINMSTEAYLKEAYNRLAEDWGEEMQRVKTINAALECAEEDGIAELAKNAAERIRERVKTAAEEARKKAEAAAERARKKAEAAAERARLEAQRKERSGLRG